MELDEFYQDPDFDWLEYVPAYFPNETGSDIFTSNIQAVADHYGRIIETDLKHFIHTGAYMWRTST